MEKRGLGRGLNSLFGDYNLFEEEKTPKKEVKMETKEVVKEVVKEVPKIIEKEVVKTVVKEVPTTKPIEVDIGLIDRNPTQPRHIFDEKALSELAQSIKSHGVIQPLIVTANGDRYTIVAGERRWRASIKANLKTVPVVVKNYSEQQIAEIAIIENLQREDLNPIESARAIKELMTTYNMTQEKVADKIGKSRPAVANTLRLLTLPTQIVDLVLANKLSAGHARALLAVEDEKVQKELAVKTVEKKLSVRDLEQLIKKVSKAQASTQKYEKSVELKAFVNDMNKVFATKVDVLGNDNKGRIIINYYSAADLQRIYDIINSGK